MDDFVPFPPSKQPSKPEPGDPAPVRVVVNDTTRMNRGRARSAARREADFSAWKALQSVFGVAIVVASLFTLVTPKNLSPNQMITRMFQAVQPVMTPAAALTATPSPRQRIGLVAGHWGNDPGSVCADGLTEMEVNLRIASLVKDLLVRDGFEVDVLKEFDPRLTEYKAIALVSIHNDSCDYVNDQATGFKVAAAPSTVFPEKATRLTACLSERYQQITGLSFHYNTVTDDMTKYHAFGEIHSDTTAAIIETGFLNLDREILTKNPERVAQGVASGILCYVRNEDLPLLPTTQP